MDEKLKGDLLKEIETEERCMERHALKNHRFAYGTAALGVIGSISATIMVAIGEESVSRWVIALVAALPAASTAIANILRFEPRSHWFYSKKFKLSSLRRKMKYENVDIEIISRELSCLEQKSQESWVGFGTSQSVKESDG